jgi:hypothetical protein
VPSSYRLITENLDSADAEAESKTIDYRRR